MQSESLFYYNVDKGFDYHYYNSSRPYTPVFDFQPTAQQQQRAEQLCTVNGVLNRFCAFDYYATGNEDVARNTANVFGSYTNAQNMLGLSVNTSSCHRKVQFCGR